MNKFPACAHIKDDGQGCNAIAVKGTPYCYFHRKYYQPAALPGEKNYQAPLLESHASIQIALTQLYQAFLAKKIDMKEAQFGLRILQLASKTITAMEKAERQEKQQSKTVDLQEAMEYVETHTERKPEKAAELTERKPVQSVAAVEPKRGVWDPYGCLSTAK